VTNKNHRFVARGPLSPLDINRSMIAQAISGAQSAMEELDVFLDAARFTLRNPDVIENMLRLAGEREKEIRTHIDAALQLVDKQRDLIEEQREE
jgi:uncharacterized membrane protein YccC